MFCTARMNKVLQQGSPIYFRFGYRPGASCRVILLNFHSLLTKSWIVVFQFASSPDFAKYPLCFSIISHRSQARFTRLKNIVAPFFRPYNFFCDHKALKLFLKIVSMKVLQKTPIKVENTLSPIFIGSEDRKIDFSAGPREMSISKKITWRFKDRPGRQIFALLY